MQSRELNVFNEWTIFLDFVKRFEMFTQLKRIVAFVFLFGMIGKFFMKPLIDFRFLEKMPRWNHSIREDDDLYRRRLPHFIIIGVKKCGTSEWVYFIQFHAVNFLCICEKK